MKPTVQPGVSSPSSLNELLRERARAQAAELAFTFLRDGEVEEARYTFARLDARARAIAAHLQRAGDPGARVLLLLPAGLEYIAGFFGCLYAGMVAVPTYPPRRERVDARLIAIVEDAEASLVLSTREILTGLPEMTSSLQRLKRVAIDAIGEGEEAEWQEPAVSPETLAFLQYTSGSTGTPKGVMVSHGNLLHNAEMIKNGFQHDEQTVFVGWAPLFHDMGLIGNIIQPLYVGIHCVLMAPASFSQKPYRWLKAISDYRATTSGGPNFAYDLCVRKISDEQRATLDLSHWKKAFNGAEPIRVSTMETFSQRFAACGFRRDAFYTCYGMAETTLLVTGSQKDEFPSVFQAQKGALRQGQAIWEEEASLALPVVSCGPPWPEVDLRIVDPVTHRSCPERRIGEVWVAGPDVTWGYWRRPQATEETYAAILADTGEGPFLRTGDLGFLHEGELYFAGRHKDLIIIRGQNHYPQDIELTAGNSHPALNSGHGAAFSVERDQEERLVLAYEVQRSALEHLDVDAVVVAMRQAVAEHHELTLEAVVLLKPGTLPRTSSGKIQRRQCRQDFEEGRLQAVGEWRLVRGASVAGAQDISLSGAVEITGEAIREWLVNRLSGSSGLAVEAIRVDQPFTYFGLDSASVVGISGELSEWLGRDVPPTLLYDYPNIAALAGYLQPGGAVDRSRPGTALRTAWGEPIAIVGIGCRFPQADDASAFWRLLEQGVDAITPMSDERRALTSTPDGMSSQAGLLQDIARFDAAFFGISPREARSMDPQQRLLLEVSWQALEDAGIPPGRLAGSQTGVFIGICSNDYMRLQAGGRSDAYAGTGNALSIAANRLSYVLDLRGPSKAVDTACSSSLVALHDACRSLMLGDCDAALAGGVNLCLAPDLTEAFTAAQMLSPEGRCKTFDASADGYVRGEGCGVLVLKRLSDAEAAGDRVLAVIRSVAVNQDGRSNGLTAPNGPAQQAVIRQALRSARVQPWEVGYIEAHGTGTPLGDPVELGALAAVYGTPQADASTCYVGSVKTNIGHLEAAAGLAGVVKAVLILRHGLIPPHLHLTRLNPAIDLTRTRLRIATEPTAWPAPAGYVGVSSFGFGGTNAHLILAPAPARAADVREVPSDPKAPQILTLSARSEPALHRLVASYRATLQAEPELSLAALCHSANRGRTAFEHRLAIVTGSTGALEQALLAYERQEDGGWIAGEALGQTSPKIGFLFTGQGAQYAGMAQTLYRSCSTFRKALEACQEILEAHFAGTPGGFSLRDLLYPAEGAPSLLNETGYTQVALFAVEYALAAMWQSWGIRPSAVLGHSVGEYVAACIAGVFSLSDGLKLIAARGRLMQALCDRGAMASLPVTRAEAELLIQPFAGRLVVAAVNAPESVVISGPGAEVDALIASLEGALHVTRLAVSHAFHSPMMEPMLEEFARVAAEINYSRPELPVVSNVSGQRIDQEMATPGYWSRHVLAPVLFADGMASMARIGCEIFLEIGPKPTLLGLGRQCLPDHRGPWLPSLRPEDELTLLQSVAHLYVSGAAIDWDSFYRDASHISRHLPLPGYPFQRKSYWIDPPAPVPRPAPRSPGKRGHPLLGRPLHVAKQEPGQRLFEALLSSSQPAFLADHQVFQTTILPASGFAEIALAAAAASGLLEASGFGQSGEQGVLSLRDLELERPLVFSEAHPQTVQTLVRRDPAAPSAGLHLEILSLDVDEGDDVRWIRHATGRIVAHSTLAPTVDLAGIRSLCPESLDVSAWYRRYRQLGMEYGAGFRAITALWRGPGRAVGRLRMPETVGEAGIAEYSLHPVLLDAAFQTVGTLLPQRDEEARAMVPVGITELRVFHPREVPAWVVAQRQEGGQGDLIGADLELFSEDGRLIAAVVGLQLRPISRDVLFVGREHEPDWYYTVHWQARSIAATPLIPAPSILERAGVWLVFLKSATDPDAVTLLARRLTGAGQQVIAVFPGDAFHRASDNEFVVSPKQAGDFRRMLEAVTADAGRIDGVVFGWSVGDEAASLPELRQAQARACGGLLHLVQALANGELDGAPRLWLLTNGAVTVDAGEERPRPLSHPSQALVWGLGEVIALEHPELRTARVDLDSGESSVAQEEALLEAVLSPGEEDHLAFREGRSYVARLRPGLPPQEPSIRLTAARSYLVTGGLGGVGLTLGAELVALGAEHLVLLGRSQPSTPAQQQIEQWRASGIQVEVLQADVADEREIAGALEHISRRLPPLAGVVHAAGVLHDGLLALQDWAEFSEVLKPKVDGAWNLHRLTASLDLDFFVLLSSAASLLGSVSQGAYAAANAYLDALAHLRRGMGLPALSINWGIWSEVGMATRRQTIDAGHRAGFLRLTPRQGRDIFRRLLASSAAQVGVVPLAWPRFLEQRPSSPFFEHFRSRVSENHSGPSEFVEQLALRRTEHERRELLAGLVQAELRSVLGWDAAHPFSPRHGFFELGMDSLLAVEVTNRLQMKLGLPLPATLLFKFSTLDTLQEHLLEQLTERLPRPASPTSLESALPDAVQSDADQQAYARVAHLSEGDLEALIDGKLKEFF